MLSLKDLNAAQEEIYTEVLETYRGNKERLPKMIKLHAQANISLFGTAYQEWVTEQMFQIKGQAVLLNNLEVFTDEDFEEEMKDFNDKMLEALAYLYYKTRKSIHAW